MTTSAPSQPAPATATPSEPARFRVVIPPEVAALLHGESGAEDLDALEPAALPEVAPPAPAAPAAPAPAPAPAAVAPVAPAAPEPTDARTKRAEEVWSRVEESVRQARGTRSGGGAAPSTELSDTEWGEFTKGIKEEIAKSGIATADDYGAVAEKIFEQVFVRLRDYDKRRAERDRTARWQQKMEILQENARALYPDFDQVISEAGLWGDGIPDQNGTIRDPALARQIYSDGNPPDAAYQVGLGRLAQRAGKSVKDFLAERGKLLTPSAPPAPVVTPPPPAPVVAAHPGEPGRAPTVAEVARQATAETLERMASHSGRPRGLRALEPASPPQNLYSFDQLKRLMDQNPDGFLALVEANPGLDQWFMNGGKAVE